MQSLTVEFSSKAKDQSKNSCLVKFGVLHRLVQSPPPTIFGQQKNYEFKNSDLNKDRDDRYPSEFWKSQIY